MVPALREPWSFKTLNRLYSLSPHHRCVFARAFLFSFWAITITNSVIIIAILIVIIIVTAHEGASVFARILEQAVVQAMYSMGWGADGHPYFLEVGLVDDCNKAE